MFGGSLPEGHYYSTTYRCDSVLANFYLRNVLHYFKYAGCTAPQHLGSANAVIISWPSPGFPYYTRHLTCHAPFNICPPSCAISSTPSSYSPACLDRSDDEVSTSASLSAAADNQQLWQSLPAPTAGPGCHWGVWPRLWRLHQ
jgi:hypothetical protein